MKQLTPIERKPVTPLGLVKYAGASGDFNELHTIPAYAAEHGHRTVVVHGMLLMGWGAQAIQEWFPGKRIGEYAVRFTAVTYPDEPLIISGSWKEATGEGELAVASSSGEVKMQGRFTLEADGRK